MIALVLRRLRRNRGDDSRGERGRGRGHRHGHDHQNQLDLNPAPQPLQPPVNNNNGQSYNYNYAQPTPPHSDPNQNNSAYDGNIVQAEFVPENYQLQNYGGDTK